MDLGAARENAVAIPPERGAVTDVAGIRGETDADALAARLRRAIVGYLGPA